jgi:hypothetical protein
MVTYHTRERSLFDHLELGPYLGKVDIALLGAGVGKPNILVQLKPLKVPCIDAGYLFMVWENHENKWKRAFCATDDEWYKICLDPIETLTQ